MSSSASMGARLAERRREERAEADTRPIRVICGFCEWHQEGSLGECRRAAQEHREAHHPEACKVRRTQRHLASFRQPALKKDEAAEIDTARRKRAHLLGFELR